jgi:hypothetical protein
VAASGPAPAGLDFTSIGTSFASLSPLLDQVFFIGDGLTGDGSGSVQQFIVPTGATVLYLGISDAPGYQGDPGAYGDNGGAFTTSFDVTSSGVPDQSSALALLTLACVSLIFFAPRLKRTAVSCS